MSTTTNLGAKAANSLREKRRAPPRGEPNETNDGSCSTAGNESSTRHDDAASPDAPEAPAPESGTPGRSKVYSFFDPADIRGPPTSPASVTARRQPFDEPPGSCPSPGGGGDDAASRCSQGSAATERIANHWSAEHAASPREGGAAAAAVGVRPNSSTWIMDEREVKYEEGATELFLLVEDAKWEEVCDR